MVDVIIFSIFDLYLISLASILLILTAIRYFGLAKKKENQNEQIIVNAFSRMFVGFTIYSILLNLSFLYLESNYDNFTFWGNVLDSSLIEYIWLTKLSMISYFTGLSFFFYAYEKVVRRRMHIMTLITLVVIILILSLPYEFVFFQFHTLIFAIIALIYLHSLFNLMKWSQKQLRAATSFIILGSWFLGSFLGYMSPAYMQLGVTPILVFPTFLVIGILLFLAPTIFKPEFFSRKINYWYFFSLIVISIQFFSLIYTIIESGISPYMLSPLILIIFFIIECSILIKFIKNEDTTSEKEDIGVLGIFTRPDKITEEEVSVSQEKKICLTCKGKLKRIIYMCPECNTFYCQKCILILSDLENTCWVCDTIIDKNKPIKQSKTVDQHQIIVEEINKNKIDSAKDEKINK